MKATFEGPSILAVEASTTGPMGGDAGHGGETTLVLRDVAATCWEITVGEATHENPHEVRIVVRGDSEGENLIKALEFAVRALLKQWEPR